MRLIVIGDLHGCFDELQELLGRLSPGDDDIVTCVGDFVTKGPKPVECVDLWRRNAWRAVLGNNDREVLRVIRGERAAKGMDRDARTLEERPELVEYLASLPLVVDLASLDSAIVHGGVLPHESFATGIARDYVVTLRDVVRDGAVWRASSETDPEGARRFWADEWRGDRFVVYGHTPRPEAAAHPRALGIDTGCVYGWCLTAAIRSDDGRWTTTSVPARRAWSER